MKKTVVTTSGKIPHIGIVFLLSVMTIQAYFTLPASPLIVLFVGGVSLFFIAASLFIPPITENSWRSTIVFTVTCLASTLLASKNVEQDIFRIITTDFFLYWVVSLPLLSFRLLFTDKKRNRMLVPLLAILCFSSLECMREPVRISLFHSLLFYFLLFIYIQRTGKFPLFVRETKGAIRKIAAFCLALGIGLLISISLKGKYTDIYFQFFSNNSQQLRDFNSTGALHDLNGMLQSQQVVLRVQSKQSPGYLRNKVFASFDGATWHADKQTTQIPSDDKNIFHLRNGTTENEMHIFPALDELSILPHLINTRKIRAPSSFITLSHDGNISTEPGNALPYTLFSGGVAGREIAAPENYLGLPPGLKSKLERLSGVTISKQNGIPEKILTVKNHLSQNHQYSLHYRSPAKSNAILDFIENKRAAHCEYFATSTVLLLRMAGVPARYVTGLVNPGKGWGYFIYRANNAHAWAEAWNGSSWEIVETTPLAISLVKQEADLFDWLRFCKKRFFALSLWNQLASNSMLILGAFTLLICSVVVWYIYGLFYKKEHTKKSPPPDTRERELFTLFEMKLTIARDQSETLEEYRSRLLSNTNLSENVKRNVQSFITLYSQHIYGGNQVSIAKMEHIVTHRLEQVITSDTSSG